MTAEEIRAVQLEVVTRETEDGPLTYAVDLNLRKFEMLREIAAQLAAQNDQLREDQEFRRATFEEQRVETKKRDELLSNVAGTTEAFRKNINAPSSLIPVFRPVAPGDMPQHLGCFLLMPDGSHGIAIEGGIVPLEPEEAQRIIAVLSKPSPGKPQ